MKILKISLIAIALAGCNMSAKTFVTGSSTEKVTVQGKEGYKLRALAMYSGKGTPDAEGIKAEGERVRNGTHGGSLKSQASSLCPKGYEILSEGELTPSFYMILANKDASYRINQEFVIACK